MIPRERVIREVWDNGYCCGLLAAQRILDRCLPEAPTHGQAEALDYFRAALDQQLARQQAASKAALASDDPQVWAAG
jgi:hypothetical protein